MAVHYDVEQSRKAVPLVTSEGTFVWNVNELAVGVNTFHMCHSQGLVVRFFPPASLESGARHLRSKPMLQVSLGLKILNFENMRRVSPG